MKNTRQRMTARFHELRQRDLGYDEIVEMLRIEFYSEPPSVHDAALSAAIVELAREVGDMIRARLKENS